MAPLLEAGALYMVLSLKKQCVSISRLGTRRGTRRKGHIGSLPKPGVTGSGLDEFEQPSDVAIGLNGDIYVADGHRGGGSAEGNVYGSEYLGTVRKYV